MKYKFLVIALLICSAVKAQTTAISPSRLKAAEDVLVASGAGNQLKENMAAMVTQASANVPEDKKPKFIEIMKTFMGKYMNWDLMKDQIAAIYAQGFSEKELKDLATFYRSPLGVKLNQKQPALFQKSALIGQQAVQSHQSELQQMMQEAFKTP